jgi:hypothetical protein
MTLAEHEDRLVKDEEYRSKWIDEEVRSSSEWFVQQLSTKQKDTQTVT